MNNENNILVLLSDAERRRDIKTLLDFLGETAIVVSPGVWQNELLEAGIQPADVLMVFLDGQDPDMHRQLKAVTEWADGLPVIQLGEAELKGLPEETARRVIGRLSWPPNYTKLVDSLYRAQVYRAQYARQSDRGLQRGVQLFRSLVGTSRAVQNVRLLMGQVANKDVSVLILGESGTGKEVVARNLHYHSERRDRPFVPVNCGAIPSELLESELFGHEKGAFTGAISARVGRFELAEGGTLFLDEIGELPLTLQAKMLRALQSGEIQRVGSDKPKYVNVRILAATNRNLDEEIAAGRFRRDLYHRLSVFPVEVPPLRARHGDIPMLAGYFIEKMRVKVGLKSLCISPAALEQLQHYAWPGNVRELEHVISRASLRAKAHLQGGIAIIEPQYCDISSGYPEAVSLPPAPAAVPASVPLPGDPHALSLSDDIVMNDALTIFQRDLIAERLASFNQNWSQAAKSLGMDRGNLHRMAKRLGLK